MECFPTILSTLALLWSMMFLISYECLGAPAIEPTSKPLENFGKIGCNGTFEERPFNQTVMICEHCEVFFPVDDLSTLCQQNCFTNKYFNGCAILVRMEEELPQIRKIVAKLQRTDPEPSKVTLEKQSTTREHEEPAGSPIIDRIKKMLSQYFKNFATYSPM